MRILIDTNVLISAALDKFLSMALLSLKSGLKNPMIMTPAEFLNMD